MKPNSLQRKLLMGLGLLACLTIIVGGGMGVEIPNQQGKDFVLVADNQCCDKPCDHKQDTGKTFIQSPKEAIPGAANSFAFDCSTLRLIYENEEHVQEEKPNPLVHYVNDYFRVLLKSLIQPNAP
jgi:hypothetical protein